MSNPSKQKGTAEERRVLLDLEQVFPHAHRTPPGSESCDIETGVFPVEVKHRDQWGIKGWVKACKRVHGNGPWALFVADGDRRLDSAAPDVVVVPREFFLELIGKVYNPQAWSFPGGEQ